MFLFWGIKSHGANTSFLRSYFCPECKAWHLTSAKNLGSSKSARTTRKTSEYFNHGFHGWHGLKKKRIAALEISNSVTQ